MIADILETLVEGHGPSNRLGEMVLDEWDTLSRRKRLFNGLSNKPLGDILDTPEGQQFLQDWDVLAKRRNNLAHGHYYYRGSLDALVLDRLKKDRCNPVATAPGTDLIDVDTTFHSRYVGSEHEEANRYGTLRCNVRVTGSDGNEVSTGSGSDRVTRDGLHSSSKSGSSSPCP